MLELEEELEGVITVHAWIVTLPLKIAVVAMSIIITHTSTASNIVTIIIIFIIILSSMYM